MAKFHAADTIARALPHMDNKKGFAKIRRDLEEPHIKAAKKTILSQWRQENFSTGDYQTPSDINVNDQAVQRTLRVLEALDQKMLNGLDTETKDSFVYEAHMAMTNGEKWSKAQLTTMLRRAANDPYLEMEEAAEKRQANLNTLPQDIQDTQIRTATAAIADHVLQAQINEGSGRYVFYKDNVEDIAKFLMVYAPQTLEHMSQSPVKEITYNDFTSGKVKSLSIQERELLKLCDLVADDGLSHADKVKHAHAMETKMGITSQATQEQSNKVMQIPQHLQRPRNQMTNQKPLAAQRDETDEIIAKVRELTSGTSGTGLIVGHAKDFKPHVAIDNNQVDLTSTVSRRPFFGRAVTALAAAAAAAAAVAVAIFLPNPFNTSDNTVTQSGMMPSAPLNEAVETIAEREIELQPEVVQEARVLPTVESGHGLAPVPAFEQASRIPQPEMPTVQGNFAYHMSEDMASNQFAAAAIPPRFETLAQGQQPVAYSTRGFEVEASESPFAEIPQIINQFYVTNNLPMSGNMVYQVNQINAALAQGDTLRVQEHAYHAAFELQTYDESGQYVDAILTAIEAEDNGTRFDREAAAARQFWTLKF